MLTSRFVVNRVSVVDQYICIYTTEKGITDRKARE